MTVRKRKSKFEPKPQSLILKDENGHYLPNNDAARMYSEEDAISVFNDLANRLRTEDAMENPPFLSIQEIIRASPFSSTKFYAFAEKIDACKELFEDMINSLNSIINRKALEGNYHPTAAIWRHKQLRETDRQVIEQEVKEQPMFLPASKEQESLPEGEDSDDEG